MSYLFDLSGKRAVVTNATYELGMAMAKGLAEAAAELIINGTAPFRVEKTVKKYESQGHKVHSFIFDVTRECRVREHDDRVEKEINPVNVLVNNAAIIKRILLKDMDIDECQKNH